MAATSSIKEIIQIYLSQPMSQTELAVFKDGSQDKTDIGAAFTISDKAYNTKETKQQSLRSTAIP